MSGIMYLMLGVIWIIILLLILKACLCLFNQIDLLYARIERMDEKLSKMRNEIKFNKNDFMDVM